MRETEYKHVYALRNEKADELLELLKGGKL